MGLSIFEKMSIIFELFSHNPFVLLLLLFIIVITVTLLISLYTKKKCIKYLAPFLYLLFIIVLLVNYYTNITKGIALFIDDLFFQVYFPSIALYIFILLINLIVLFCSFNMKKITKYSKIVNAISFSILQLLFALFLFVITNQKLDVTDWTSLYQNKEVLAILEISMSVFIGWLLLIVVGYSMRTINKKADLKEEQTIINKDELTMLNELVKKNVFKLSEEVERLKQQLTLEREYNKKQLLIIEQKIELSNKFFIDKLNSKVLPDKIHELEKAINDNQLTLKRQLVDLQKMPIASKDYVDKQVILLEKLMNNNNKELLKQIVDIQNIPTGEIDIINAKVEKLETFIKRYMIEMNHQIVQTRKEIIRNQNRD